MKSTKKSKTKIKTEVIHNNNSLYLENKDSVKNMHYTTFMYYPTQKEVYIEIEVEYPNGHSECGWIYFEKKDFKNGMKKFLKGIK